MFLVIAIATAAAIRATSVAQEPAATDRDGLIAQWSHDFPKAIAIFSRLAAEKDPAAMTHLGADYATGIGVLKDDAKACELYLTAAKMGYAPAETAIGLCLEQGREQRPDISGAVSWLEKAASQGDAGGEYNLAIAYDTGTGVKSNRVKATELMRRAADQGFSEAAFNLGLRYQLGLAAPKSIDDAVAWYLKAAEHRNSRALRNLGFLYADGIGVQKDLKRAFTYLSLALEYRPVGIRDDTVLAETKAQVATVRDKVGALLGVAEKADALGFAGKWKIQHQLTLTEWLSDEQAGP